MHAYSLRTSCTPGDTQGNGRCGNVQQIECDRGTRSRLRPRSLEPGIGKCAWGFGKGGGLAVCGGRVGSLRR